MRLINNQVIILPFFLPWGWTMDAEQQTANLLSIKNKVVTFNWQAKIEKISQILKENFPNLFKD